MRSDTREIFRQLSATPGGGGGGVKCIIENHDAWVNSEELAGAVRAETLRLQLMRPDAGRGARIEAQRLRLQALVTPLRKRVASAG